MKITSITIAVLSLPWLAPISGAIEPDQLIEHTEFLTNQSPALPADDFPYSLSEWTEEQLSYAVDPVDEMIGGAPSDEIIERARQKFDRHVTNEYKRKLKLWCLDFYEGATEYMARTGEEINADALPGFLKKSAAGAFKSDPLMQRWFARYASMHLDFIAEKWKQIQSEELFASNAVNAFNKWRKEHRKELTALRATAVKVASKSSN